MKRNEAREQAFLLLFSSEFQGEVSAEEVIANAKEAGEYDSDVYTRRLVEGVLENRGDIDAAISEKLTKWKIGRLPKTSLAILRVGCYEILYCEDVPDSVAINEAVELAKRFGSERDFAFINGVLGNIARGK